jgi:hypothetical protein
LNQLSVVSGPLSIGIFAALWKGSISCGHRKSNPGAPVRTGIGPTSCTQKFRAAATRAGFCLANGFLPEKAVLAAGAIKVDINELCCRCCVRNREAGPAIIFRPASALLVGSVKSKSYSQRFKEDVFYVLSPPLFHRKNAALFFG